MKKYLIITLIFVLSVTLFAGCRRMGDTNPTTPSSSSTTSTAPTTPNLPLPSGTNTTNPSGSSAPELPGRMVRPSNQTPRY